MTGQPLVGIGIRQVLADLGQVSEYPEFSPPHWAEAVDQLDPTGFDVVVVDTDGTDRDLPRNGLRPPSADMKANLLVLSSRDDPSYIRAIFACGASGFLDKQAPVDELVAAVEHVAHGRPYLRPALGARFLRPPVDDPDSRPDANLSDREREIVRLAALGHTHREIARALFISIRTVETHLLHIRRKLDVPNRAALVRYAMINLLWESPLGSPSLPAPPPD